MLLITLLFLVAPTGASAQDQLEVLQTMLCEIRELRAVLLQGQVGAQLLTDNRGERELVERGSEAAKERRRALEQQMKEAAMHATGLQESLRTLRVRRAEWSPERLQHEEQETEKMLRSYESSLADAQNELNALSAELTTRANRLAELAAEYERLKRQVADAVVASAAACDGTRGSQ
jgi:chromosome segregation ATPase